MITPDLKALGEIMAQTPVIFARLYQKTQYFIFSSLKASLFFFPQSFPGQKLSPSGSLT